MIWAELVTPDLVTAKHFYGNLLGWQFDDIHLGAAAYAIARLAGTPVAGLLQKTVPPGAQRQSAWVTFISVPSVPDAERSALSHGGKVISPPISYARRGRQAVLADPEGAVFAVLQSVSGDPSDALASPGEWIWSSLLARDPDSDALFYRTVFGYEIVQVASTDGLTHLLLATDGYARASANALPRDQSRRRPHWLDFIRVSSVDVALENVKALGGRVLVEAHRDRHGGLVAVVVDPEGAPFGLLEWPSMDMESEAN